MTSLVNWLNVVKGKAAFLLCAVLNGIYLTQCLMEDVTAPDSYILTDKLPREESPQMEGGAGNLPRPCGSREDAAAERSCKKKKVQKVLTAL